MNGDELKVPSQRADRPGDDNDRDHHLDNDNDNDKHGGQYDNNNDNKFDDRGADGLGEESYRDPYARTGDDMVVEPDPAHVPEGVHVAGPVPETAPGHEREPEPIPATAVAGEPPAHAAPQERALFDQDPAEVQARWRDLQAAFVDDPGEAVQRADGLVGEVVETLTSTLNARTGELRERWKDAGDSDTEQLRLALREYRGVLERLLALSGPESR
ncbi:hypothetical protein [Nonomuraea sp. SBT364]|uniref:hypothetical protein n=1 Tax=Nonomuraea sp. SBT364 TaxID=1580530 RepID=UPI00069ED442|nr:hypothetical protein [Nonomuraea sp. SBT364]